MSLTKEHPNLITIISTIVVIVLVSVALFATNQGSFQCELEDRISSWEEWKWFIDKLVTIFAVVGAALAAQNILHKKTISREIRARKLDNIQSALVEISDTLRIFKVIASSEAGTRFDDFTDIYHKITVAETALVISDEDSLSLMVAQLRKMISHANSEFVEGTNISKNNMHSLKKWSFQQYFDYFMEIESAITAAYLLAQKGKLQPK